MIDGSDRRVIRVNHLDASAAVRLVVHEDGSEALQTHFLGESHFQITNVCLIEALGVLKRFWLNGKKRKNGKKISQKDYFLKAHMLLAEVRTKRIKLDEIDISSSETFRRTEEMAKKHDLDLSDSLQLVSVKFGKFSRSVGKSKTLLITADDGLEQAAKNERLLVWNCRTSNQPPPNS